VSTVYAEIFRTAPLEGPAWLTTVRQRAMARFEEVGFPTTRNEDWHFTSPAPIAEARFTAMAAGGAALSARDIQAWSFGQAEWPLLVFVNGRHVPALSRVGDDSGVKVMSLAAALREEPSLLEQHLTKRADIEDPAQVFSAINTALMTDGAVVQVPRFVAAPQPIHLLFISDAAAAGGVSHPRVLLVAEPGSQASIVEQYVSAGGSGYFTNAVTEAWVGDGATLHHFRLQREARDAFHVGTSVVRQERDSHFLSFSFVTGAALARVNVYAGLHGPGCGATLNGLYMLDGTQHTDHQTRIEHAEPDCYSRELYKGVLDDSSHGVFNGKVYVHPEAQKTDGKQTNNALLLSERARIDTKPQLEIFADDVKCTHGATVGRIDETALFYMKSRGIPNQEARKLLTYAFAAEVLETIPVDALRDGLERLTLERFTGTMGV
jgi:Fe-S cluster assembly protein SufD